MRRKHLTVVVSSLLYILIIGCNGLNLENRTIPVGELILNQDKINSIKITEVEGGTNETTVAIDDPADRTSIMNIVKKIPVKRITIEQDNAFAPERIQQKYLSLEFNDYTDPNRSIQGWILVWPDGYIYAVDIDSMVGSKRTVSYSSESTYPEVYTTLYDKMQR